MFLAMVTAAETWPAVKTVSAFPVSVNCSLALREQV